MRCCYSKKKDKNSKKAKNGKNSEQEMLDKKIRRISETEDVITPIHDEPTHCQFKPIESSDDVIQLCESQDRDTKSNEISDFCVENVANCEVESEMENKECVEVQTRHDSELKDDHIDPIVRLSEIKKMNSQRRSEFFTSPSVNEDEKSKVDDKLNSYASLKRRRINEDAKESRHKEDNVAQEDGKATGLESEAEANRSIQSDHEDNVIYSSDSNNGMLERQIVKDSMEIVHPIEIESSYLPSNEINNSIDGKDRRSESSVESHIKEETQEHGIIEESSSIGSVVDDMDIDVLGPASINDSEVLAPEINRSVDDAMNKGVLEPASINDSEVLAPEMNKSVDDAMNVKVLGPASINDSEVLAPEMNRSVDNAMNKGVLEPASINYSEVFAPEMNPSDDWKSNESPVVAVFNQNIANNENVLDNKGKTKDNRNDSFNEARKKQIKKGRDDDVTFRPPSLMNMGATCYLNSAFQGISSCDTFVEEINDLCKKYDVEGVSQLHVFKELVDILNGSSKVRMEISRNPIFRNWNKPGQQDSYELLAYALNQVYNQLRKHKEATDEIPKRDLKKWLQVPLPMRLLMQYEIKCGCGLVSYSPLQSDLALHVTIPGNGKKIHLDKMVDLYFGIDPIEDYECDKSDCDGKGTNRLARLSKPLPHTICVHLQRTFWNGYTMKKIDTFIPFDTTLTMYATYWTQEQTSETTANGLDTKDQSQSIDQVVLSTVENNESSMECGGVMNGLTNGKEECSIPLSEGSDFDKTMKINEDSELMQSEGTDQRESGIVENNESSMECGDVMNGLTNGKEHGRIPLSEDSDYGTSLESSDIKDCANDASQQRNGCPASDTRKQNEEPKVIAPAPEKDEEYDLVSVIVHSGTVYGGHYICYKRVGERWFLTNDSSVYEVKESEVLKCQAYILFYEQPYDDIQSVE